MKCPHCRVEFHDAPSKINIGTDEEARWCLIKRTCPACGRLVLFLEKAEWEIKHIIPGGASRIPSDKPELILVWPKGQARPPCPVEVPQELATDYTEACLVLTESPKASAALSRRCLQNLLRETARVKHQDLAKEIQEVIDSKTLPSYLVKSIDAIRNIGNFGAHPLKSTKSGEILPVESGEAEWNLDVLEGLFDFYFVQPAIAQRKKVALNKKLQDAGKPPMK